MSSNKVQTMLSQYSFSRSKEKLKHQSDDEEEIKNDSLEKSTDEISSAKEEENEDWEKTSSKDEEKAEESTSDDSADENLYFKEEKKVSDESDEASDGKSPVFEKKSETKSELESSEIDDDDDYDDDDFNESDDRESDWDSDEHQDWSRKRGKSNGFSQKKRKKKTQKQPVKRRYRRPVSDDNSDDDDDDTKGHYTTVSKAVSEKDKVKVAELNTLVLLYPHKTRDELEEVLNSSKNLDDAINSMIAADPVKVKRKHKDSGDGAEKDSAKKVKRSESKESSDSESQEPDAQTIEERMDFLSDAFTAFSRGELRDLLRENKWCLEKTIVWLASGEKSDKDVKKKDSEESESGSDDDSDDADIEIDFEDSEVETAEQTEQNIIQSFFDDATLEELMGIPGCSKKKAEIIISLRPFKTYDNLLEKLESTKALTSRLIGGGKEVIHMREVVIRLMKKCEKISKEMGDLASYLVNAADFEEDGKSVPEMKITKQPPILNPSMELKPYQLVGLNWLRILHSQEVNGILADEMGLGKTVQAIAFLAYLLEQGESGPHVIIVPSSTIDNWMNEIQRWCPAFNVLMYYGSQEERQAARHHLKYEDHDINIILTTYNMATGCIEDRVLFKKTQFHYAVFDEGHMLKNMSSLRYQNLMKIQADRRLLLTGTPLQNNLLELISLLCFVMPEMFVGKTEQLKKTFTLITKSHDDKRSNYEMERINHAKKIMRPFILRRLKSQVLQQMPKKQEEVIYCQMIPDQQEQYENLINRFTEAVEGNDQETNTRQCMLMQLRKTANHPLLQRRHFNDSLLRSMSKDISKEPSHRDRNAQPSIIYQDMEVMSDFELHKLCLLYRKYLGKYALNSSLILDSGKFRKFDELLPEFKENGDRVLIFSQFTMMLDIIEEYLKIKEDIKYLRLDGQTPVHERQGLINNFNDDSGIFIFLLSTRAGGLGINLTSANVVIIHDIDFNPYNDKQAEDRCHRMGQTKTVKIFRLLSKDTVEEAMFRCAQKKLTLEKDVTSCDAQNGDNEQPEVDVESLLKEVLSTAAKKTE